MGYIMMNCEQVIGQIVCSGASSPTGGADGKAVRCAAQGEVGQHDGMQGAMRPMALVESQCAPPQHRIVSLPPPPSKKKKKKRSLNTTTGSAQKETSDD